MATKTQDWQTGRTLKECNRYMMANEILCDVSFKVGSEAEIVRAHKLILASRSSVFYAMLFGSLADQTGDVVVPDIEPDIFKILLKFIYCDDVDIDENTVVATLYAADKYGVLDLLNACKEYLEQNITSDTACIIFDTAKHHDFTELSTKCMTFILSNPTISKSVLDSPSFLELSSGALIEIFKSDELLVEEIDIFRSLVKWGEQQCRKKKKEINEENLREVIKDKLVLVRFPVMDMDTFVKEVSVLNVLSVDDKLKIIQSISGIECEIKFSAERRIRKFLKIENLYRGGVRKRLLWRITGPADALNFTVDRPVMIHGIIMFGCEKKPYKVNIEAKLLKGDETITEMANPSMEGTDDEILVHFNKPVKIEKNISYTIWVKLIGPLCFQGTEYKSTVELQNVTFNFSNSELSSNRVIVNAGQIPGILFSTI